MVTNGPNTGKLMAFNFHVFYGELYLKQLLKETMEMAYRKANPATSSGGRVDSSVYSSSSVRLSQSGLLFQEHFLAGC